MKIPALSQFIEGYEDNQDPAADYTLRNEALVAFVDDPSHAEVAVPLTHTLLQFFLEQHAANATYLDYQAWLDRDHDRCCREELGSGEYIDHVLAFLYRVETHEAEGLKLGLSIEEIALHDMLQSCYETEVGTLYNYYESNYMKAAQQLVSQLDALAFTTTPEAWLHEANALLHEVILTLGIRQRHGSLGFTYLDNYLQHRLEQLIQKGEHAS